MSIEKDVMLLLGEEDFENSRKHIAAAAKWLATKPPAEVKQIRMDALKGLDTNNLDAEDLLYNHVLNLFDAHIEAEFINRLK